MKETDFKFKPDRNDQNRRLNKERKHKKRIDKATNSFMASFNFDRQGICCSEKRGVESSKYTNVTVPRKYLLSERILEMYKDLGKDSLRVQFSSLFPRATQYVASGARLKVPYGYDKDEVLHGIPVDNLSADKTIYRTLFVPERFIVETSKPREGDTPFPNMFVGGPSRDNPDKRFSVHEPYAPWIVEVNPLMGTFWDLLNGLDLEEKERFKYNPHIYLEGSGPVLRRADLADTEFMHRHGSFFEHNKQISFELEEEENTRIIKAFEKTFDFIYSQGMDDQGSDKGGVTRSVIAVEDLTKLKGKRPKFTLTFMPVMFTNIYSREKNPLVTGALMALLSVDQVGIDHLKSKSFDKEEDEDKIDRFITHLEGIVKKTT